MIKAVLFDIDNTLLDFDACVQECMREGFEAFGLGQYREEMFGVFQKINSEMWKSIDQGTMSFEELLETRWNRIFAELNITFDGRRFENFFIDFLFESAIPIPGSIQILESLKNRYILCAASNGPCRQQINRLTKAGMLPMFSKLFISEEIGASKPSSEFFAHCMRALNEQTPILPDEVLMVGDSLSADITGALSFGMKACHFDRIGINSPSSPRADYTIHSLDELHKIL